MRNKFTKWFLIILCSVLIGLYFGLGTIFGFFYFFGILGISTIVILILFAIWKKTDKKLIFSKRVYLTLIIGLIFSLITVKTKNYVNKEIAESLIADINTFTLNNKKHPKTLSELVPTQTDRIPKHFDNFEFKNFEYWRTESGDFRLNYYLDGWHKSETNDWKTND